VAARVEESSVRFGWEAGSSPAGLSRSTRGRPARPPLARRPGRDRARSPRAGPGARQLLLTAEICSSTAPHRPGGRRSAIADGQGLAPRPRPTGAARSTPRRPSAVLSPVNIWPAAARTSSPTARVVVRPLPCSAMRRLSPELVDCFMEPFGIFVGRLVSSLPPIGHRRARAPRGARCPRRPQHPHAVTGYRRQLARDRGIEFQVRPAWSAPLACGSPREEIAVGLGGIILECTGRPGWNLGAA
jgi:hypothetical protein